LLDPDEHARGRCPRGNSVVRRARGKKPVRPTRACSAERSPTDHTTSQKSFTISRTRSVSASSICLRGSERRRGGISDQAGRLHEWARAHDRDRSRETPPARLVHVPGEGRTIPFDQISDGSVWAAADQADDVTITLRAPGIPIKTMRFVRLTDLAPYAEESHRLRTRWRIKS
jgi:hypothetical protein